LFRVELQSQGPRFRSEREPYQSDFDDAVAAWVDADRFDVDKGERATKAEVVEHDAPPQKGTKKPSRSLTGTVPDG
jgi:hypothetical protein